MSGIPKAEKKKKNERDECEKRKKEKKTKKEKKEKKEKKREKKEKKEKKREKRKVSDDELLKQEEDTGNEIDNVKRVKAGEMSDRFTVPPGIVDEEGNVLPGAEAALHSMLESLSNLGRTPRQRKQLSEAIDSAAKKFSENMERNGVQDMLRDSIDDERLDELIGSISLVDQKISCPRGRNLLELSVEGAATNNCAAWTYSVTEDPEDGCHMIYFNGKEVSLSSPKDMLACANHIGLPGLTAHDMNKVLVRLWLGLGGYERDYCIKLKE